MAAVREVRLGRRGALSAQAERPVGAFPLAAQELRALLAAARLEPTARSPLRGFGDGDATDAPSSELTPELARALELLCRPELRVALIDRTHAPALRLDAFFADGWAVALHTEDGRVGIAAPVPRAAFEAQLAELLVSLDAEGAPAYVVPDTVLATLACCMAAGVDEQCAISRGQLAAALAEFGLDAQQADATLDALVADELLTPYDGGLALGPACQPFGMLLSPRERLVLAAWPLDGPEAEAEGDGPARMLAFAGRYGARLLITEDLDGEEPGTLVGPVGEAEAGELVAYLLDGEDADEGWTLVAAPGIESLAPLGGDAQLTLDGSELLALVDVLCGDGGPLPADEPADAVQGELRGALEDGLASLAARGLVAGEPARLAGPCAAAVRAWLDPELVVSIERTDAGGSRELRCSIAAGVLALDATMGAEGGTIELTGAVDLGAVVARVSGLEGACPGGDPIEWALEGDADPFARMPELVLGRAAVHRTTGDLVEGEELAFAHAGDAGCWEIDETAVEGDDDAPTGVVRLVPTDPSVLLERLLAAAESGSAAR